MRCCCSCSVDKKNEVKMVKTDLPDRKGGKVYYKS